MQNFNANPLGGGIATIKNRNPLQILKQHYETDGERSPVPRYIGNWGIESGAEDYLGMNPQMMGYVSSHDENRGGMKQKLEFGRPNAFQNLSKTVQKEMETNNQPEPEYNMLNSATLLSFLQ